MTILFPKGKILLLVVRVELLVLVSVSRRRFPLIDGVYVPLTFCTFQSVVFGADPLVPVNVSLTQVSGVVTQGEFHKIVNGDGQVTADPMRL